MMYHVCYYSTISCGCLPDIDKNTKKYTISCGLAETPEKGIKRNKMGKLQHLLTKSLCSILKSAMVKLM